MYGPSGRMRAEREETRRSNAGVIISTVLSLLVVAAAVAVVAYLVLREPSSAVDSAQRLDPVGTALPAPTSPPELPTVVPTEAPAEAEPTALGFSGEQPAVAGLPTVAAPAEEAAGPTPTPRLIAQPTDVPPTPVPAAPTLPPSVPVTAVPVVALQPVEAAAPVTTSGPAPDQTASQPTPAPRDDDPFDIFNDENESRIVPAVDDPLQRVRDMQDEQRGVNRDENGSDSDRGRRDDPVIVPAVEAPEVIVPRAVNGNENDRVEPGAAGVTDIDAMIDEITARATDPSRNPNVNPPGRSVIVPSNGKKDDKNNGRATPSKSRKNPQNPRDRDDDEKDKDKDKDRPGAIRPNFPSIQPNSPGNRDSGSGVCTDPNAPGFPFDC